MLQLAPKIDTEFQAICPTLSDVEYGNLEESIKKEGCRDALVVWNSILLDGHNRYNICKEHDIEFKTTEVELADRDAAIQWIIQNALARRNLTPVQKIELAERFRNILEEQAKKRKRASLKQNKTSPESVTLNSGSRGGGAVNAQIGKIADVCEDNVRKYRKARPYLSEEELERLRRGDLSIHAASRLARDKKAEQERSARPKTAAPTRGTDYELTVLDIREGLPQIEDSSIGLILTDPPYGMGYVSNIPGDKEWNESGETNGKFSNVMEGDSIESHNGIDWSEFFRQCHRVLKDGTYLFIHCNVRFIAQHLAEMEDAGFRHKGTLVWNKGSAVGGDLRGAGKRDWEPILYLAKGEPKLNPIPVWRKGKLVIRDRISEASDWTFILPAGEKCGHPTQKPVALAKQIILWACPENGTVFDPFCGSGTTGVATKELGHRFIGFDIEPNFIDIAASRLAEEPKRIRKRGRIPALNAA